MDIHGLFRSSDDSATASENLCATERVIIESGALQSLQEVCAEHHGILMVSDQNT